MRKHLSDSEAKYLGLGLNKIQKGKKKARYVINNEQWDRILNIRSTRELTVFAESKLMKGDVEVMKWVKTKKTNDDLLEAMRVAIDTLKEGITPTLPVKHIKSKSNKNICNQYTLTDYHLGMMAWGEETGENWDLKKAEKTLIKFFEVAIQQSPKADEAIFAQIGDFLHWDGLDAVTPMNKNVLDADTRFPKLVRTAIRVIRKIIEMLLKKYNKVTLIMAEGNHDPASSVWLREVFSSFYENETRLIIDTNPDPYYCVTFGKTCLFYHHGHKRGLNNIDTVFVSKFKQEFGASKFVYAHIGHLHNLQVKETNLMLVEQHRTLAASDTYASRSGYMSGRDSKVITYHKKHGEVGRVTINYKMLQ